MNKSLEYIKFRESQVERVADIRVSDTYKANTFSYRTNADVDYARILYSSSFRRLQGKMQLFVPGNAGLFRNRLTHSHEVAQIAKTLAQRFGLKDTLTVQTCSLAHDLGNPPFGHAGEVFLQEFRKVPYEGNAQTFRILNWIEERHHSFPGLNLTIRTMLGIVKYFDKFENNQKKFLYDDDYDTVLKWFEMYEIDHKTVDCEIMDIADEIAYAAHDLEDALKLKYFTIDDLIQEFKIRSAYSDAIEKLKEIVLRARSFAEQARSYETSEEYSMLFRKELTSQLVAAFVADVEVVNNTRIGYSALSQLSSGLKKLTFEAIKRQPDIIEYEQLGKHVLQKLYELYLDAGYNKDLVLLPANYRDIDDKDRSIQDYLGGMTDIYAIQQYEKYYGSLKDKGLYFRAPYQS